VSVKNPQWIGFSMPIENSIKIALNLADRAGDRRFYVSQFHSPEFHFITMMRFRGVLRATGFDGPEEKG
jgi:hypothetical protein